MKFILNNWKWIIPTIGLIVYIVTNQFGCVGKSIREEVTVRDTIYSQVVIHDTIKIPVPVEKQVIVSIAASTEEAYVKALDSLQRKAFEERNYFQKVIVEKENIIAALKHNQTAEVPIEVPTVTANLYEDTVKGEDHTLKYAIGVVGFMESFDYELTLFKPNPPAPPKLKKNAFIIGMQVDFRGEMTPKLGFMRNNIYVKLGYTVNRTKGFDLENGSVETGYMLKF